MSEPELRAAEREPVTRVLAEMRTFSVIWHLFVISLLGSALATFQAPAAAGWKKRSPTRTRAPTRVRVHRGGASRDRGRLSVSVPHPFTTEEP